MKEEILAPLMEEDRMLSGMAYPLWFLTAWMTLLSDKKEEPFVRFNCIQALVFGIISSVGFMVVVLVLSFLFRIIPFLANFGLGTFYALLFVLFSLMFMALVALTLFFAYRASQGTFFYIPFLHGVVDRFYYGQEEQGEDVIEIEEVDINEDISTWK